MSAPNSPQATCATSRRARSTNSSYNRLDSSGGAGARERRAVALAAVGIERELGNHEHFSRDVCEGRARMVFAIGENAHLENLGPQLLDLFFGVVFSHAEQDEEPTTARTDRRFTNIHARAIDSLYDCTHANAFRVFSSRGTFTLFA